METALFSDVLWITVNGSIKANAQRPFKIGVILSKLPPLDKAIFFYFIISSPVILKLVIEELY